MADRYFRLVCFVVNICPEPLRKLFLDLAKADATFRYTTLDAYLKLKEPDIRNLKKKGSIRNDQYNSLYSGTVNESEWDVSLLVPLITGLFAPSLQSSDKMVMRDIRQIRNDLQHLPSTKQICDAVFNTYWGRLETAVKHLAKKVFSTTREAEISMKIMDLQTNHLPDLGDCLRLWYEETIKQMANKIDEMSDTMKKMKTQLDKVESNSSESAELFRNMTIQKPGAKGNKRQRIMAVDGILKNLQARFASSIRELPDNFNAPAEAADIRTKLRDKHYVVVTGSYNSRYFETALKAISEMNYHHSRCVEMQTSSDWRHIDPEDVDLVLCRDPFGNIAYDENKAKSVADIFSSMKLTADGDSGENIDIVIVTDFAILRECKQMHDHDMLDEIVNVFNVTTKEQPADLTFGCDQGHNITFSSAFVANNLRVITGYFLQQYSIFSKQVDTDVLKTAKDKIKASKAIVLTGPGKCGKTSAAVALTSSYEQSRCLLLTGPNDIKLIDYRNVCLVIIDEFAGKYQYQENTVLEWLNMFDYLYAVVSSGHLNVIVTCEISKLNKCSMITDHPLIQHRVDCAARSVKVKREMTETSDAPFPGGSTDLQSTLHASVTDISNLVPGAFDQHVWSVVSKQKYNITMAEERSCYINGLCQLQTGEFLLADDDNKRLKKLDAGYRVIDVCDVPHEPRGVCYIGNNEAVVSLGSTLQFVDVTGMTLTRSVSTEHDCIGLTCHGDQLYVIDRYTVYMYSTRGIKQRVLYTHTDDSMYSIVMSDDGSKMYIACWRKLTTIDSSGNLLSTFSDPELCAAEGVCVDGEGHALLCDWSDRILQISSDGKHKLGTINISEDKVCPQAICFDRHKSVLTCAGSSDNVLVLQLK